MGNGHNLLYDQNQNDNHNLSEKGNEVAYHSSEKARSIEAVVKNHRETIQFVNRRHQLLQLRQWCIKNTVLIPNETIVWLSNDNSGHTKPLFTC